MTNHRHDRLDEHQPYEWLSRIQPLALFGSMAVLCIALKLFGFRQLVRRGGNGFLETLELAGLLDVTRATVAFYSALIGFSVVFLAPVCQWFGDRFLRFLLYGTAVCLLLLEVLSCGFYSATGSALDGDLLAFGVWHAADLMPILTWDLSLAQGVLALLAILGTTTLTFLFLRTAPRLRQRLGPRFRTPGPLATVGLSLLFLAVAWMPSMSHLETSFVRAPLLTFAHHFITRFEAGVTEVGEAELPGLEISLEAGGEGPAKNIVIILLESVRARSTTIFTPELATTPFLSRLAADSIVAERAYAVVPHTSKALTSILCGIEPYLGIQVVESLPGAIPARCLPKLLVEHGYRSIFLQGCTGEFENWRDLVHELGFAEYVGLEEIEAQNLGKGFHKVGYSGFEEAALLHPTLDWIDQDPERPFLLVWLTTTTHHPYTPPPTTLRRHFVEDPTHDDYLNSLARTDATLQRLFESLRRKGVYRNTLFVLVADHGEGFGEHRRFFHDTVIYDEGLHIPLLIHLPGSTEGGLRIQKPVNHLDILPTLADLLELRVEGGVWPGESLLTPQSGRFLKAYCHYDQRCLAVIGERFKYIHHFDDQPDELFDLIDDPLERVNLAANESDRVVEMHTEGEEWLGRLRTAYRGYMRNHFRRP